LYYETRLNEVQDSGFVLSNQQEIQDCAALPVKTKPQNNSTEAFNTKDRQYTTLLETRGGIWWKKALDVQAPFRWNLRRLNPGFVLDIGCGLGRNLIHLKGHGVGVDHNPYSVEVARSRGLRAFTPEEFELSEFYAPGSFDSILLSHVAEHMMQHEVVELLSGYIPLLKPEGKTILITPQEYGFRSDPTHVQLMTFENLRAVGGALGLIPLKEFSFPFPRLFGRIFKYNEFVSVFRKA
jgi:SAM-dependent methyltransferase